MLQERVRPFQPLLLRKMFRRLRHDQKKQQHEDHHFYPKPLLLRGFFRMEGNGDEAAKEENHHDITVCVSNVALPLIGERIPVFVSHQPQRGQ